MTCEVRRDEELPWLQTVPAKPADVDVLFIIFDLCFAADLDIILYAFSLLYKRTEESDQSTLTDFILTVPDVESSQKIINKIVFKMFHLDFDIQVFFFLNFLKNVFGVWYCLRNIIYKITINM